MHLLHFWSGCWLRTAPLKVADTISILETHPSITFTKSSNEKPGFLVWPKGSIAETRSNSIRRWKNIIQTNETSCYFTTNFTRIQCDHNQIDAIVIKTIILFSDSIVVSIFKDFWIAVILIAIQTTINLMPLAIRLTIDFNLKKSNATLVSSILHGRSNNCEWQMLRTDQSLTDGQTHTPTMAVIINVGTQWVGTVIVVHPRTVQWRVTLYGVCSFRLFWLRPFSMIKSI